MERLQAGAAHIGCRMFQATGPLILLLLLLGAGPGTGYGGTGEDTPPAPGATETHIQSEPGATETHIQSEPGATETHISPEPGATETHIQSEPGATETHIQSEPGATETHISPEPGATETHIQSEPGATETHIQSEPGATETHIQSEPGATETHISPEPGATETHIPPEPGGTRTHISPEPGATETHISPEPGGTKTHTPPEPGGTRTQTPSKPGGAEAHATPEPDDRWTHVALGFGLRRWSSGSDSSGEITVNRTFVGFRRPDPGEDYLPEETGSEPALVSIVPPELSAPRSSPQSHIPSKPARTVRQVYTEPGLPGIQISTEPQAMETHSVSEELLAISPETESKDVREYVRYRSERNRTDPEPDRTDSYPNPSRTRSHPEPDRTDSYPEPSRTRSHPEPDRTDSYPEPSRTRSHPEPDRTDSYPEPSRTRFHPEPDRTDSYPEPSKTESHPEPDRTDSYPEPSRTRSHPEPEPNTHMATRDHGGTWTGSHIFSWSERGRTEPDLSASVERDSATDLSVRPEARRHVSKRMSHTDTMYVSTSFTRGGDRTLLSVTNGSILSGITEITTSYRTVFDSTQLENGDTDSGDSGNRTETGFGIAVMESGNSTQDSGTSAWASSDISTPGTDPLLSPYHRTPTDSSLAPHRFPDSTMPFTSFPVTVPNITDIMMSGNSSLDLMSSSLIPSSVSSVTVTEPSYSSLPFTDSSTDSLSTPRGADSIPSSFPTEPSSSSPIPSTLVSSERHSASASSPLSEVPSVSVSTNFHVPLSTQSTVSETSPASTSISPSPSADTMSPPGSKTWTRVSSMAPKTPSQETTEPSASNHSLPGDIFHTAQPTNAVTETTRYNETQGSQEYSTTSSVTATKLEEKSGWTVTSIENITSAFTMTAQQTDSLPPWTTSEVLVTPPLHYVTEQSPPQTDTTTQPTTSGATTSGANLQATSEQTATRHKLTTTVSLETSTPTTLWSREGGVTQASAFPATVTFKYIVTDVAATPTAPLPITNSPVPATLCSSNPCQNGGRCAENRAKSSYQCECPPAWQGSHCHRDVDECLSDPCPPQTTCTNIKGSFSCRCAMGYMPETGAGCILARTFLGLVNVPRGVLSGSGRKYNSLRELEEEILSILNSSFASIDGYYQTTVTNSSRTNQITVSVQSLFSLESNVTAHDLTSGLQSFIQSCNSLPETSPGCHLALHPQLYYFSVSLCNVRSPGCDKDTAECSDLTGVPICQCKPGYFKYSRMDHSCRACDDGFKREQGTCVR
uniref:EGF-like domain-containing protein n=1 Tax=Leptobrachium leishanense TaxID=445787 RepID=A0A8C5PLY8_9ANUR